MKLSNAFFGANIVIGLISLAFLYSNHHTMWFAAFTIQMLCLIGQLVSARYEHKKYLDQLHQEMITSFGETRSGETRITQR